MNQLDRCRTKDEWQITHMFGSDGSKSRFAMMFPVASGMLFRMKSVRSVLSLIRRLEDTTGKGCRSGSDLH